MEPSTSHEHCWHLVAYDPRAELRTTAICCFCGTEEHWEMHATYMHGTFRPANEYRSPRIFQRSRPQKGLESPQEE
jgi:hypothetical protein